MMQKHLFKAARPQTGFQREMDRWAWQLVGGSDHRQLCVVYAAMNKDQMFAQSVERMDKNGEASGQ